VYLPDDLKAQLKRVARSRGVSEATVIRDAIRAAVTQTRPAPRGGLFEGHRTDRSAGRRIAQGLRRAVIVDTSALLAFFDRAEPEH